jgi:thiol-disulfide isomerase/thioredoxin
MKKKIILFSGTWCRPCQSYKPTFDKVANQTPNVDFETIDVDSANNLIIEYQIRNVPTTVVVNTDGSIKKQSGIMSERDLKIFIG